MDIKYELTEWVLLLEGQQIKNSKLDCYFYEKFGNCLSFALAVGSCIFIQSYSKRSLIKKNQRFVFIIWRPEMWWFEVKMALWKSWPGPLRAMTKKMIDTSIYSNLSWPWPLRKGVFGAFSPIHIYVPWMSSSLNDYVWFSWPRFTNTENLLGPSFIGRPHCQTVHKVIGRRKSVEPGVNLKCRIDRSSNIDVFNATRNDLIYVRTFIPFHLSQDIFI